MRILFLSGREITYTRNDVLLRALRRFSTVDVVSTNLPPGSLIGNSLYVSIRAIPYLLSRQYDLVVIGFYGYLIVQLLQRFLHTPILFDAFVSNYDTLVGDRGTFAANSWRSKLAFWLDKNSCQRADHILLDTEPHVDYFTQNFGVARQKLSAVPVGCNDSIFTPQTRTTANNNKLTVLYYCTFLPLHGVETVLQAAKLIHSPLITFRILGDGPQLAEMKKMANILQLSNVTFAPSVSLVRLTEEIAAADLCLGGHFGNSEKAQRVIPGKIYQLLAMGKAVIASNSIANRSLLKDEENALLVPPADAPALANAIQRLVNDPQLSEKIGQKGRATYCEQGSEQVIDQQVKTIVEKLIRTD